MSISAYITDLVAILSKVYEALRDDGTLWLNLGDGYAKKAHESIKRKDLIGLPWAVAFALRDAGWYLRSDIVWAKPNPMPENIHDRPTRAHEFIFLLTKQEKYYYDYEAVREPAIMRPQRRNRRRAYQGPGVAAHRQGTQYLRDDVSTDSPDGKRNKRSVWTVPTQPFKGAHFAVFPPALIEPCVLTGCPKGGMVLDPFMGAGTTGVVALQHGRNFTGIELNPYYADMARDRLKTASLPRAR